MVAGALKYYSEIAANDCGGCPPSNCSPVINPIKAVRFACSRNPDSNDFVPVAMNSPQRLLNASQHKRCSCFALSFYESAEKANECLAHLATISKSLVRKWGYLHTTTIQPGDGLVTPIDHTGHFDLHEFGHVSLETQSALLEML